MQTYTHYKESGIDWIGQIPEHWEVKKITHLFSKVGSGTTPTAGLAQYYENGSINFLQTGDLNDNLITNTSKKITENALKDCSSLKIYPKGSLVIAMYGATIGKLGILDIETTTNQACCVLGDNKSNVEIKYIFYWFSFAKKQIISMSYGGGQPNISQDLIKSLRLNFPPIHEQEAIANFLDDKTAKIDALVHTKEQQIEKLKELRQAKIHQAVTKGLDAHAPAKDSGIEWIGQIPEHWEVKRLKNVGNAIIGLTYSPNDLCDSNQGTLVLRSSNLQNNGIEYNDNVFVKTKIPEKLKLILDDIVICSRNGSRELIGKCGIVKNEDLGNTFGAFTTVFRSNINKFLFQILSSGIFKSYSGMFLTSTINQLTISNLNSFEVPIPPIQEQEAIVAYLDEVTGKIDQAITQKQVQITKLKEYKQSLINDVVTGKVKVC